MFVDRAKISVKAGDGGNGCCSFRREKFVPNGGPDGGDGGAGGNVILRAVTNRQSLVDMVYQSRYAAQNGPNGKSKDMHGRKGDDIIVELPVGTIVVNDETEKNSACGLSLKPLLMPDWWDSRMPVNPHFCVPFRPLVPKSLPIHSPPCIPMSVLLTVVITAGILWQIFRD